MRELDDNDCVLNNESDLNDLELPKSLDIVTYSRDWTISTIYDQIKRENIELNPDFQRRNAWKDDKRSKLIESILMEYPIPEIVLAADKKQKGRFIVIDGKQRLLTLMGYMDEKYKYWDKPQLRGLTIYDKLNGTTWEQIKQNPQLRGQFENSSLRCTVISNYSNDDVLYDIFYRLNSGSSPLATQELRQVLCKGSYGNYLIEITKGEVSSIQKVMNLNKADDRLRDVEVILRIMSFVKFSSNYKGNLKKFLDLSMNSFNELFDKNPIEVTSLYTEILNTIDLLYHFYDNYSNIGRVYRDDKYESRFNRVMLELQVFYFYHIRNDESIMKKKEEYISQFKLLCKDLTFSNTFSSSTKNIENYKLRYTQFQKLINKAFELQLDINPFK